MCVCECASDNICCCCCSVTESRPTLWHFMDCALQVFLSFTISQSLLKFMAIELVMLTNHLILCHPLLFLLSIFPSIRVFSNESVICIRWPKYCSFSFSISPSNEYSGLIFFRIDWFGLLEVQRASQESSPAPQFESICSSALSLHYGSTLSSYMTTGKTIALTVWTFVAKVMSLLLNILSRCVIAFFLKSKSLLISWLQSLSTVIMEPKKIKCVTVPNYSP